MRWILLLAVLAAPLALAGPPDESVELELRDGRTIKGKLLELGSRRYRVEVDGRVVEVNEADVLEVRFARTRSAPARLDLAGEVAYERSAAITTRMTEHARNGSARDAREVLVTIDADLVLKAGAATADSRAVALRIPAVRLATENSRERARWQLPAGAVLGQELALDARGAGTGALEHPTLWRQAETAGCPRKLNVALAALLGQRAKRHDGPALGIGPVLPATPATTWTDERTRLYGVHDPRFGPLDDPSLLTERWEWRVLPGAGTTLDVEGRLAGMTVVASHHGRVELSDVKGSARATLDARTGVVVSASEEVTFSFTSDAFEGSRPDAPEDATMRVTGTVRRVDHATRAHRPGRLAGDLGLALAVPIPAARVGDWAAYGYAVDEELEKNRDRLVAGLAFVVTKVEPVRITLEVRCATTEEERAHVFRTRLLGKPGPTALLALASRPLELAARPTAGELVRALLPLLDPVEARAPRSPEPTVWRPGFLAEAVTENVRPLSGRAGRRLALQLAHGGQAPRHVVAGCDRIDVELGLNELVSPLGLAGLEAVGHHEASGMNRDVSLELVATGTAAGPRDGLTLEEALAKAARRKPIFEKR